MKDGGMIMEPDETLFVDNGHRHAVTVAVSSVIITVTPFLSPAPLVVPWHPLPVAPQVMR